MKRWKELTTRQKKLVKFMLVDNGCGASNAESLIHDNFSCQGLKDFRKGTGFSTHELDGVLGSLMKEEIICLEQRPKYDGGDLYWISDVWLGDMSEEERKKPFSEFDSNENEEKGFVKGDKRITKLLGVLRERMDVEIENFAPDHVSSIECNDKIGDTELTLRIQHIDSSATPQITISHEEAKVIRYLLKRLSADEENRIGFSTDDVKLLASLNIRLSENGISDKGNS